MIISEYSNIYDYVFFFGIYLKKKQITILINSTYELQPIPLPASILRYFQSRASYRKEDEENIGKINEGFAFSFFFL